MGLGRDYLGNYRLIRMIRAGQTCQIWESIRDSDRMRVALKVLQPELRGDKVEIGYLRHEHEVAKDFDNPHVIKIYEFNEDRTSSFLVMEYNGGRNIKMVLRDGFDHIAWQAQTVLIGAAKGLDYLHVNGWIHRDVKPDNFIISGESHVKIIDFALAQKKKTGLAKLLGGKSKVQGTRSYMAPEQIRGQAVDERADIYSFGCLMFEVLTGKLPFTGVSPEDLLRKHLSAPIPPPMTANRNVTPDASELVTQLMAKDVKDRPNSMTEVARRLNRIRLFRTTPKKPEAVEPASPEP